METIGIIGVAALAMGWVPQTIQTIREKDCQVNFFFLILNFIGSVSLTIYAFYLGDAPFSVLNSMTSIGAIINIFYKVKASWKFA